MKTSLSLSVSIALPVALVAVLAMPIGAQDRAAGLATLAQAERDFAKLCVAKGVAHAFHEHFADEGIGFNPLPVKVREQMAKRPPLDPSKPRAILDWHPVLSDLAASGEMGFNLGPSVVTPPPGDAAKPKHGYFFSIWEKQADGRFKVTLDIGTDTAAPLPTDTAANWRALRIDAWTAPAGVSIEKETAAVRQQEAALGDAIASRGALAAYTAVLGSDFRLLQNDFRPIVDKDGAAAHFKTLGTRAVRRFEPRHVGVARSADFAYSWGPYNVASTEQGYYAHVWRRDAAGTWRLVVEVIRPTPAQPTAG